MSSILAAKGTVKYFKNGETYYVKQNFAPSALVFRQELKGRGLANIPETFFSNGPVEKLVSLLASRRCNAVSIKMANEMDLTPEEVDRFTELVGPDFYFSRSAEDYNLSTLPHQDPEIALGHQVVLDTVVRNWDDGERNYIPVEGVPVWFDFGASLDPRYQNVYRFILKLEDERNMGRIPSIVNYFMGYSRRRSQILRKAMRLFHDLPTYEIRALVAACDLKMPAYCAEYISRNLSRIFEEIDIIRESFLKETVLGRDVSRKTGNQ